MLLLEMEGLTIDARAARYKAQTLGELVLSCVDSMDSRREIWAQVQVQGRFIAYGDLPGGLVLFPKPAQPITKVDFLLNAQHRAASRNDLTHRAFDY